jgi:GntR family transcriptional regulator of vanillate catabolism
MSVVPARPLQKLKSILQLREMILSGELKAGERVAEIPLAARLGVSRTPLRMALMSMEHEGLLQSLATGGFVVRAFETSDIADAIELRGAMEGIAARLAAERMNRPHLLSKLADLVERMEPFAQLEDGSEANFEQFILLNGQFHQCLVEMADSPILTKTMDQVLALPFASPNAFLKVQIELGNNREIRFLAQQQHRGICESIHRREGSRAEALAREHARLALRNLNLVLNQRDMLTTLPGAALIRLDPQKKERKRVRS